MFTPPRCPFRDCPFHRRPPPPDRPPFFRRCGSYHPLCRPRPVPRFHCKRCRRTFSRQTFRADYYDHRPDLNAPLVRLLASGLGLRQSARLLGLRLRSVERKFRKLARHLHHLHRNLLTPLPSLPGHSLLLMLDELETFETSRLACPVTVPLLIEPRSGFLVAADAQPIRPAGRKSPRRARQIARAEARDGRRPARSREAVRRVLGRARRLLPPAPAAPAVHLLSDQKKTYPRLAREAFGRDRVRIAQYPGTRPRTPRNPLFPVNLTLALARDLCGRLRRRSWLASKQRRFLRLQLAIFQCYRNYVRPRTNGDPRTPAQRLGILPRRLGFERLLGWRQDFRERSIEIWRQR